MIVTSIRVKVRLKSGFTATTRVQPKPNVFFQHLHFHKFTKTASNVFKFLLTSDLKISMDSSKQQRLIFSSVLMLSIIIPTVSTFMM